MEHGSGPLLVLAGAGSGKTRVLTRRIARLIEEQHAAPSEILAVTFTNKAAAEMRARVAALLGDVADPPWIGTFHSVAARLLRRHVAELDLGLSSSFVVYDTSDSLAAMEQALKERDVGFPARALLSRIDQAKNEGRGPANFENDGSPLDEATSAAYPAYERVLRRNDAVDFGDLLLLLLELFERVPATRERYQRRFRYLLVDEYQDTNRSQYAILRHLAAEHRNLCVVGDEDQSIYRWRGADLRNILDFEHDYPDVEVVRLEQNYRSTQRILAAAGAVIRHNRDRKGKTLWTENEPGALPVLYEAEDEQSEARFIASRIARLRGERRYSDFVVFYRTNAQSRVLEEVFLGAAIPYALVGGLRFYERKEVKDLLAYLRVIANPSDEAAWLRIINVPARGIGATTVGRRVAEARASGKRLAEVLAWPPQTIAAAAAGKVTAFAALVADLRRLVEGGTIEHLVEDIFRRTGLLDALGAERTPEAESRRENLREFLGVARDADVAGRSLSEFLEQAALVSDADLVPDEGGHVTLMTLHTSKGLEFPVVFLAGMEEGIFPHHRSQGDRASIEEERRLCYVGMTRARERLFLTRARRRRLMGVEQSNLPSRFLDEIPAEMVEMERERVDRRPVREWTIDRRESQLVESHERSFGTVSSGGRYSVGARVRHPTFGLGVVRASEGKGDAEKVTVRFAGFGDRKLIARLAALEIVT